MFIPDNDHFPAFGLMIMNGLHYKYTDHISHLHITKYWGRWLKYLMLSYWLFGAFKKIQNGQRCGQKYIDVLIWFMYAFVTNFVFDRQNDQMTESVIIG